MRPTPLVIDRVCTQSRGTNARSSRILFWVDSALTDESDYLSSNWHGYFLLCTHVDLTFVMTSCMYERTVCARIATTDSRGQRLFVASFSMVPARAVLSGTTS